MQDLNLPKAKVRIEERDGKKYIFDPIRKKMLMLTPEEWVRQQFLQMLFSMGVSKGLVGIENGLKVNKQAKRSDLLLFDRGGSPFLLIECKAPSVKLSNTTFEQVARYNATIKAPYIGITNGMQHYFCAINFEKGDYSFLKEIPLPSYIKKTS
ncbi:MULTISPECIES: type I restriction enzyme HsdR N-terminal domain-containing protein [Flammeovirga]|uniref:Type I restriction enzyme HsdR N-terminal domain-containing protein n=1 Tax=Flammeovirga agarivorans TaxID=2726742 RepID=A0A7X8SME7_9BACT|nr:MULTISPECIES: type I restriction enzyme HsdR N-terminal domain-containing protein [Flammeovirga]NLR92919.1 type I restriction enzyme HsdR N-terminal domain-containing protein [Flammeovirga agarivorans]